MVNLAAPTIPGQNVEYAQLGNIYQSFLLLQSMFPALEDSLIQTVLDDHDGDCDSAVESLLTLSSLMVEAETSNVEATVDKMSRLNLVNDDQNPPSFQADLPCLHPVSPLTSKSTIVESTRPLSLLSLDGGGYRGLSILLQLRQIMRNIPSIDPYEKLYPHKYFDLIGGTSTGGLIALMLGRLGMDIDSAIQKYEELGSIIFERDRGGFLGVVIRGSRFNAAPFEKALTDWLQDEPMVDSDLEIHCRCFVTAVPANLASVVIPTILRSYRDPPRATVSSRRWLIREAARATSAAPAYFPPLDLGRGYIFKDAGAFGFNNPTSLVLNEAQQIPEFNGRIIGCVVSLGTGLTMLARKTGPTFTLTNESERKAQQLMTRASENAKKMFRAPQVAYDRLKQLKDDLVATATNTEVTHNSVFASSRERDLKLNYLRLNPPGGLDTIDLADFARGADIEFITNQYLETPEVIEIISTFAPTLSEDVIVEPFRELKERLPPGNVLQNMKKDAPINGLLQSGAGSKFSVVLPHFTMKLSKIDLRIAFPTGIKAGSCAFDLARTLGLLSTQPNNRLADFETVTSNNLVYTDDTYCARIARHYLVLLISEHVQEVWQAGDRTHASTDIGRFTIYERKGRSIVHFDGSSRVSTIPVILQQDIDDIRKMASRSYKYTKSADGADEVHWLQAQPKDFALVHVSGFPTSVRYLSNADIKEWRLMLSFATAVGKAVDALVRGEKVPQIFAEAWATDWTQPRLRQASTKPEKLALSMQAIALAKSRHANTADSLNTTQILVRHTLFTAADAHELFRGREVNGMTFLVRSEERFYNLLSSYRRGCEPDFIRNKLQALLEPRKENISLVVAQGALAFMASVNSQIVLSRAVEAPEEWIRIVTGEDGDMFIGA